MDDTLPIFVLIEDFPTVYHEDARGLLFPPVIPRTQGAVLQV